MVALDGELLPARVTINADTLNFYYQAARWIRFVVFWEFSKPKDNVVQVVRVISRSKELSEGKAANKTLTRGV